MLETSGINSPCVIRLNRICVIRPKPVNTRAAYIKIFKDEFSQGCFLPVLSVIYLYFSISEKTVPALGSMEKRVGITDICPGKPDNTGKDTRTRMGCKPNDKVPDEICRLFDVIERFKVIAFDQQV